MQPTEVKSPVQSRAYRLLHPGEVREVVLENDLGNGQVVVEPSVGSICHADLRYFTGQRRPEALALKLPMALIHEGIGKIVESKSPALKVGQRVVIVPNIPGYLLNGVAPESCCPVCQEGKGESYCYHGRFLGSGVDGIAQSRVIVPAACAIPVPDEVPDEIAVLAELCSVSYQALSNVAAQIEHTPARIAVFGDGPVGYLTAAMLHHCFGVSQDRLQVFGAVPEKLAQFDFASRALVQECEFTSLELFDIVVECTGGRFSESAINQAIGILSPKGHLILMGVTEERVPINTRDLLEKGITIIGSSRSSSADFQHVLRVMSNPTCQDTLRKLLPEQAVPINCSEDFTTSMKQAAAHRDWKKILLEFNW
ncbi:alcohol dehydrogenase catalytic domain-containing protein [Paenibacillus radicis (ex Xue et al. 2023)]|uniref:Alcohol dehydrogenase catalytic domain-containing protein n=1 Tax=Paenibacillus radicis (ex Xue et al. 2023) TaxID=2972489 RepID=A0ABT1YU31_9BACL|nr:alcohol dehydrogenase catalytic domain-containing protein [Paenibacillus radicis (ex Xue et al. 2023)]MCR8636507.1 alcohol dehydrogenase catalytic domain-containing protein [Paenibacillus radicis (ex Xue et al. 2023)]